MEVRIVSLQGNFQHTANDVIVETVRGQIQILEGHADMIANLAQGDLIVGTEGKYFAGNGLLRVENGDCVLMLDRLIVDSASGREKAEDRLAELLERDKAANDHSADEEEAFLRAYLAH